MKKIITVAAIFLLTGVVAYYSSMLYFKNLTKGYTDCPLEKKQVCAYDDYTYVNECFMQKAGATKRYDGECSVLRDALYPKATTPTKAETGCICTMEYSPVCGKDNNTYGNACSAKCANVEIDYQGECAGANKISATADPCLLSDMASREKCKIKQ